MNSLSDSLTAQDRYAEALLLRGSVPCVLFVEGESDCLIFHNVFDFDFSQIISCGGKEALDSVRKLHVPNHSNVFFFRDRDFNHPPNKSTVELPLILSEFYELECSFINRRTMNRLAAKYLGNDYTRRLGSIEEVVDAAMAIATVRKMSQHEHLNLVTRDLRYHKFLRASRKGVSFVFDDFVDYILALNEYAVSRDNFVSLFQKYDCSEMEDDWRFYVKYRDFIFIFHAHIFSIINRSFKNLCGEELKADAALYVDGRDLADWYSSWESLVPVASSGS